MKLHLEEWEVGMILRGLEELPREEAAETIRRIEEQMAQDIICCKDCAYFAPVERNPIAQMLHDLMHNGNMTGYCKKLSISEAEPILTRQDGFCHRAKRRKQDE